MSDLSSLVQSALPDVRAAVYGFLGLLGSHMWTLIRGRRIAVCWTATFQNLTPQTAGINDGHLSIQWNKQPCVNLQSCRVVVVNESGRDAESLSLLFTFSEPYEILEHHAAIATSAKRLMFSPEFLKTLEFVRTASDASADGSRSYLTRNREFFLPALNRGEMANFDFWIHSKQPQAVCSINVTTEKAGVKLVSRPANHFQLDLIRTRNAFLVGSAIAVAALATLSVSGLPHRTSIVVSFILGACVTAFGNLAIEAVRRVKRFV